MDQQNNDSLEQNTDNSSEVASGGMGNEDESEVVSNESDAARLVRTEVVRGNALGDQRIRRIYPVHSSLKRANTGVLEATPETEIPHGNLGRVGYAIKRFFIGVPIATAQQEYERLTRFKALAVLSSDAISSVAYATEAILATIIAAGSGVLGLTLPICFAIVLLLSIVALSYRQTIFAYPRGGGSYIVAKDNIGTLAGLLAAASLLIDYVLTVAVSVSAGVQNIVSLFAVLSPYVVIIDIVLVVLITVVNLRGVREAGSIFAIPTYFFIASALLLIIVGLVKGFLFEHHQIIGQFQYMKANEALSFFLILKAFAAGCSAMTGVEAISDGVPAFKKPESRNAAATLASMAVILGILFIGITLLATSYHVEAAANGHPTVIAQIASLVFTGPLVFMFPVFQFATLFVLVLAANTSYSDFPRLASFLARDNFLPHQFAFRGDRLAFSSGIMFLAVLASLLLIIFKGDTTKLINLYAVGVFMSFTLSQSGMVLHWWRLRKEHKGWLRSFAINSMGACTTFLVAAIIAYTKFLEGAWIVVILIPLLVLMFELIHRHYSRVEQERTTDIPVQPTNIQHRVIVPVAQLNTIAKQALSYARSIGENVTALHISGSQEGSDAFRAAWQNWQQQLHNDEQMGLEIVIKDHRSITHQILLYVDTAHKEYPGDTVTVVLPEVVVSHWWEYFLRNRIAIGLKAALLFRPGIVVTDISPYEQIQPAGRPQVERIALPTRPSGVKHLFVVPVAGLDRVSKQSLGYARSISKHVVAVHVSIDIQDTEKVRKDWERWKKSFTPDEKTELVVIESPFRSLGRPLLNYIDSLHELYPDYVLTVLLPEFIVAHWWEYLLHNQTAFQLKTALLFREGIIVTSVPQHLPSTAERPREPIQPLVPM